MVLTTYVAGRNSRHRIAAIALYRALVRAGTKIPLPKDATPPDLPSHPVKHFIRRQFLKNKDYTSFRLIYAAMTAGYKFLTLFSKAHTPNSAENAEIVDFLRTRRQTGAKARTAQPPAERGPPSEPGPPLLTNVTEPGQMPFYISTVRPMPKEAFRGKRKIPVFGITTSGQPFLRMKKPQPKMLSRTVGVKDRRFQRKWEQLKVLEEELVPNAAWEDQWEELIEAQMERESGRRKPPQSISRKDMTKDTYSWNLQIGRLGLRWLLEVTWQDWIARGEALQRIVEEEKFLAAKERGEEPAPLAPREMPSNNLAVSSSKDRGSHLRLPPNFASISLVLNANQGHDGKPADEEDATDPYLSPLWQALLEREQDQLMLWTTKLMNEPYTELEGQRAPVKR